MDPRGPETDRGSRIATKADGNSKEGDKLAGSDGHEERKTDKAEVTATSLGICSTAEKPEARPTTPRLQHEYIERLMYCYEELKVRCGGKVTMSDVLAALQYDRELLRVLEECTDWDDGKRFKIFRHIFQKIQEEKLSRKSKSNDKGGKVPVAITFIDMERLLPAAKASSKEDHYVNREQKFRRN